MDLNMLEQRLQALSKRTAPGNRSQSFVQNVSSSMRTMIPTPGMPNTGNETSMKATVGMIPNTVGMGSTLPASSGSDQVHSNSFTPVDDNSNKTVQTPVLINNNFPNSVDNLSCLMLQSQQGIGTISMAPANHVTPTIGMPRVRSQMIPTPGLATSQSVPTKAASVGMGSSNADCIAAAQQQQSNGGQNNHIYRNISGQMSGTMGSNMQRKNYSYGLMNGGISGGMQLIGNNPHLMNGTAALCNPRGYLNASQYGNMQITSQQHVTQQHQQHFVQSMANQMTPVAGDVYAMNAADLAGTGNFYNATSSTGFAGDNNLKGNSLGLQSAKMIPVPGLPSLLQKLQPQQQTQQNQSRGLSQSQQLNFPHGSPVLSRGQCLHSESLQQQQLQFQQHPLQHPQHQHLLEQPSCHQYQEPQNQQQMQQGQQQQLSLKRKGVQLNQPELTPFGQKQVGFESLQDTSQQEMSEQPQLSRQCGQQQHLPAKERQVQQSSLFQVHHISFNAHQSNLLQSQKLQEVQVSSPQEQKQTLSQIDPNDVACQVFPEAGFQGENESQPQEKVQPIQQGPSLVQQQQPLYGQPGQQQEPGQDKDQQWRPPQMPASGMVSSVASQTRVGNGQRSGNAEARRSQYSKQQRWLLFLRHASKCSAAEGQCQTPNCSIAQQLWAHIRKCHDRECGFPRCHASRTLLGHHQRCREVRCPVCGPVRCLIMRQRAMLHVQSPNPGINSDSATGTNVSLPSRSGAFVCDTAQIEQPPLKRPKVEPASPSCAQHQAEITSSSVPNPTEMQVATLSQSQVCLQIGQGPGMARSESPKSIKAERTPESMELAASSLQGVCQKTGESNKETCVHLEAEQGQIVKAGHFVTASSKVLVQGKQEPVQVKQESIITAPPPDTSASAKLGKPKIKGVSLTELFTPEQIRVHITGLRQWVGQSKAKAEKNQAMEHQMSENSCQLCAVEKLTFEPPPIYCTPCGVRIKRNALFYTVGSGETRHYFCIPCYNDIRGDTVKVDGISFPKVRLEKRKNDEETEEAWVSCDKCDAWQHQICALFNGRRNEGGQAEYTCPNCYIAEIERGERRPLPQTAVLGAKDLPRTYLSDHIEQRLSQQLKQEKQERARALGMRYEEVPGAEGLVVRVVSSVDKKLEVKQRFLEIFQHENYPSEYPYKSKVLLLFQEIEGVEVCLFGMYVQEFGSECSHPNQRRIYLSYLDSVKYFRPDVKTVTGEALRTFVYHEILIGYLEYCKRRGLTSCYIWACPPLKGEDYILYCHPEIQKTPKSDKLREWYLTMLRKASNENIVVDMTNLYDYFFVPNGDCKTTKVTAARLPYFDGDYLPGAAEDVIMHLRQEEEDGRKQQKAKKGATKRSSKAAAQAEPANNASKDALLMQKLGESIHPMKDDFIMVHLQHACAHCCLFIISGKRWVCSQCKNFQLCDRCYEADQHVDERERHPINSREKHIFSPVEVKDVPADTRDKDDIMESEFFDTRQAFLSLCQGNHYQYDTLRRAKHSSMMVLYHLHNPTAPAFVTTCNMCHRDIETGQGWRCETCPDFDICNDCYHKDDSVKHPHKLTAHPSMADRDAQNKEARQQRVLQLRKMLDLLAHASQCCSAQCLYPNCRRVKGLFRHGMQCRTRASGGCPLCKKMWHLLQLHARACKESECRVPRCKDLKEHLRRLQHQMESRRRAAVMEMMRQRAAEVAAKSH